MSAEIPPITAATPVATRRQQSVTVVLYVDAWPELRREPDATGIDEEEVRRTVARTAQNAGGMRQGPVLSLEGSDGFVASRPHVDIEDHEPGRGSGDGNVQARALAEQCSQFFSVTRGVKVTAGSPEREFRGPSAGK